MREDFQLLEARTADVRVEMRWRSDRPYINPHAIFSKEFRANAPGYSEHITAVIGRNGTGKSHLLSSIVQSFIILEELKYGKRDSAKSFPLEYLSYIVNGRHCLITTDSRRRIEIRVDGKSIHASGLPLPQRVVALTISPFDKFPIPRLIPHSIQPADQSLYHYLGLRDRFGKAAIETLLFRALSSLFDTKENDALRQSNISTVFAFLGLEPELTVIYRRHISASLRNAVLHGAKLDDRRIYGSVDQLRRVEEVLRSGISEDELKHLLVMALNRSFNDKGAVRVRADFKAGGILDETFAMLQPVRRAGFLRLSAVEIKQTKNGLVSDLKRASSGQLSMVAALLSLASVITNGSLVLIDEPELSLHPEWQIKYVDLLSKTFARYTGCHFVVATHSPLVISELPEHANVISLDESDLPPSEDLQGQSADYLLAVAFGLPNAGNLHVKERLVASIRLVANGDFKSPELKSHMLQLLKFRAEMEPDDPAVALINSLEEATKDSVPGAKS